MKKKIYISVGIQLVCAVLMIVSFFLPWIEKGFVSVSGFKVPELNELGTKISNLAYIFKPSKKSSTKTGYLFYLVPLFSGTAMLFLLMMKRTLPKYLLLVASILGVLFAGYFYTSMKFSYIGKGPHLLFITSLIYIVLFFTPLLKEKKEKEMEDEQPEQQSDEVTAVLDKLDKEAEDSNKDDQNEKLQS